MCSVPPVFSELIWVLQAIKERHKCPYIHQKTERLFNDIVCTTLLLEGEKDSSDGNQVFEYRP